MEFFNINCRNFLWKKERFHSAGFRTQVLWIAGRKLCHLSYGGSTTFLTKSSQVRIAEGDNTAQYWPNLGSQESAIVIGPVSLFASIKFWADDGGLFRLFKFTELQPKLGPVSALYQADSHFYQGKPSWKWENQSSAQHWPVAVPQTSAGGQSLGQHWPPSAYRSYHSNNGTILAADLREIFGDAGPVLGRI